MQTFGGIEALAIEAGLSHAWVVLEEPGKIDAAGIDRTSSEIVLSLFDAWSWEDERSHLFRLQEKLNNYFAFVETGQVNELFPGEQTSGCRIDVWFAHQPPESALDFLSKADEAAQELDLRVYYRVRSSSPAR